MVVGQRTIVGPKVERIDSGSVGSDPARYSRMLVKPSWSGSAFGAASGAVKSGKAYADKELMDQFSEELPKTLKKNPVVEVPGDVLLVSRVMGLLSGLGKTLDSKVDLFATLMPYAQQLMLAQSTSPSSNGALQPSGD